LKYDTFVSYSRSDQALVEPLVQLMRLSGRKVFWDRDSIEPGRKWADVLTESIEKCRQLLLVWCCHSSGSEHVEAEISTALKASVPIVPLLLCEHLPKGEIAEYQWIDMRQGISHQCDLSAVDPAAPTVDTARLIEPGELLQPRHIQGFDGRDDKLPEIAPETIDSYYVDALRPNAMSATLKKLGVRTRGARRFDSAQDLLSGLSAEQKHFAGLALRAVEMSDFDPHFTLPSIVFGPDD